MLWCVCVCMCVNRVLVGDSLPYKLLYCERSTADAVAASFIAPSEGQQRAIQRAEAAMAARDGSSQTDILASNRSTGEGRSACLFKGDSEKVRRRSLCHHGTRAHQYHVPHRISYTTVFIIPTTSSTSLLLLSSFRRKENFFSF